MSDPFDGCPSTTMGVYSHQYGPWRTHREMITEDRLVVYKYKKCKRCGYMHWRRKIARQ